MQNSNSRCCSFCHAINFSDARFCAFCHKSLLDAPSESIFGAKFGVVEIFGDIFARLQVKGFIVIGAAFVLLAVGLLVMGKNLQVTDSDYAQLIAHSNGQIKKVALPADAWFKKSFWNRFYEYPSANQILAKSNEAGGDAAAVRTLKTLGMNGAIAISKKPQMGFWNGKGFAIGQDGYAVVASGDVSMTMKKPDKIFSRAVFVDASNARSGAQIESQRGFDGAQGWKRTIKTANSIAVEDLIEDLSEKELAELAENQMLDKMFAFSDGNPRLSNIVQENGKTVYEVTIENADKGAKIFGFDAITGLLTEIRSPSVTIKLDDYRTVNRLNLPFKLLYSMLDPATAVPLKMEINVKEWTLNESADDAIFLKPFYGQKF